MTRVYLAWGGSGHRTLAAHADDGPVNLLVAFPELKRFIKCRPAYNIGHWCLDSGAFSAWNSGKRVHVDDLNAAALEYQPDEVFGLDVIGDPKATKRNLERSWELGIPAIPTFHGEDEPEDLDWCIAHAQNNKIAAGGAARRGFALRCKFLNGVFTKTMKARVRVHGFGMCDDKLLRRYPFHSVDATSWMYTPSAMGVWAGYTGTQKHVGARGVYDFWIEVLEHRRRERVAAHVWREQLAMLEPTA